ncbi:uncharacterized protein LOC128993080 [Macrosteles quadrilineatus]|uniref:uncharacterized protein LOC128993080 n=1 Tax=Macrosteles quadrilineatus TaxID=74068 RepID=UPI0023E16986|nr:uncharacterized protein LOC128993080 [Macrosteles quadrilineatus]
MELNVAKCLTMFFSRSTVVHPYNYSINGAILKVVDMVKDLGVITTPTLSPYEHISQIAKRASSLLGFIFRTTKDLKNPLTLIILYKTLVRPVMEYCSVVWSPYQSLHIDILDKIQRRFIRLIGLRLGYHFQDVPIITLEKYYDLQPLSLRRKCYDLQFLFKLVNGIIDCTSLLNNIKFSAPRGTRSKTLFARGFQARNYSYHHGLSRLLRMGGEASTHIDFFGISSSSFKRDASRYLQERTS